MSIKQISVFVENRPGRLARITQTIAEAGMDIRAISVSDTTDFGILRLIVDDPQIVCRKLEAEGFTASLTDVLIVGLEDAPGALAKVARLLADAKINVEYLYAFISKSDHHAYVILKIEDMRSGMDVLKESGVRLLTQEEIAGI
jgi:hypothetical protein